jgi:hypothetical protein
VHLSKFIDSEQDVSFISLHDSDVGVDVSLNLSLSELSWLVLENVVLLSLSLLVLVLLDQLSKIDFPIDIRSIDHILILVLGRKIGHLRDGSFGLGQENGPKSGDC